MTNGIDVYYDDDGSPYAVIDGESVWLEDHGDGTFTPLDEADDDDLEFDDKDIADDEPEIDPRLLEDVQRGLRDLQTRLGRPLTGREADGVIVGGLKCVFQAQTHADAGAAIEDAGNSAKPLPEMDSNEHRAWARERANESFAARNPEPELDRPLDIMNSQEDHMEYARQLAKGAEFEDAGWGDE